MEPLFRIFRVTEKDAAEIARSMNEPHVHEFEELLVGSSGRIEHFIDFRTLTFNAPFISFIAKGKVHRLKPVAVNGTCNIWAIGFSSDFIPETTFRLYSNYHEHADLEIRDPESFKRMLALVEMMYSETQIPYPKMAVVRDLLKALFTMIEAQSEKDNPEEKNFARNQNAAFRVFLKILEENFRRPEGVDFYSEKLFMSSRNLNLLCQKIINKSVSDLIITRRLIEARNLLIYTDKTVSEIGFELGYNEKSYFTNAFKKETGLTPTAFREEMHKLIS